MLQQDVDSAAVLVPEQDLAYAQLNRKADLNRIQADIEKRRIKQERLAAEAQREREAKEMEACTFAPKLKTKAKPDRNLGTFLQDQ